MRKVTKEVVSAFMAGNKKKVSNTETDGAKLWLHGNMIATKRLCGQEEDGLYISHCGWPGNTTKERLNALPGVSISQKKGIWYLNGKKWDGSWTRIKTHNNGLYECGGEFEQLRNMDILDENNECVVDAEQCNMCGLLRGVDHNY
jgi:hypothetical protein